MTQRAKTRHKAKAAQQTKARSNRSTGGGARTAHAAPRPRTATAASPSARAGTATATTSSAPARTATLAQRSAPARPASTPRPRRTSTPRRAPLRWMWLNGLALSMFGAFVVFAVLQSVFGWQVRNEDLVQAGQAAQSYWHYLGTGHFAEAIFENWESEFLQMGTYVLFTVYLFQKGSPELKPLDEGTPQDVDPKRQRYSDPPRPVRRGRLALRLYSNSLAIG